MEQLDEVDVYYATLEKNFPEMIDSDHLGLWVGPGWHKIIFNLCTQIQHHMKHVNRDEDKVRPVKLVQIKEKFGGLRFYYDGGDSFVDGMVTMAEVWASTTCEECGAPGVSRHGGWIKTLCDHHHNKRQTKD